jgi:hypothetical protein
LAAGCRAPLRQAVLVDAVMAALDPGNGVAGVLPGGPLGGLARHPAEGLLGIGDLVGAAVVLDGGGLPPGSPPPSALRYGAELAAQVAGLVLLECEAVGAALPGQLADDLPVGGAEVGVGLQPAGPLLLMLAQRELGVGGAVGLLANHRHRPGVAPAGPPRHGRRSIPRP